MAPAPIGEDAVAVDHVNLRIPEDGVEDALGFYRDRLGFAVEGLERYEGGEKPFFDVRLAGDPTPSVLHLWPTADFEPPTGTNYDHLALRVDATIDALEAALADAGVEPDRVSRDPGPLGATGTAPAAYVTDPFGYTIELKVTA